MTEQWLPVLGWEGYYEVSDQGRIRSVDRIVPHGRGTPRRLRGKVLALQDGGRGHLKASLYRARVQRTVWVHRLVLEAFVGPCPPGMECCHNNGIRTDNHVGNLRWGTRGENQLDRVRHGNHHKANNDSCPHGHEFTPENTYFRPGSSWGRQCRTCHRIRNKSYRDRRRMRKEGLAA